MDLGHWLWLATACYGIHILEEYEFNWRDWARHVLGLPAEWSDFYVVNALVVLLGVTAAQLAATWVMLALSFAALMLINASFFHVLPFVRHRGRFSPGLITAVLLFYPVGLACYWRAAQDRQLSAGVLIGSAVVGALLMAAPVVMLLVRQKAYFRQDR